MQKLNLFPVSHNCCVRWTVMPAHCPGLSEMDAWNLSSKVWHIGPSPYTGGTLFQVRLARFRWGRGRASFKSGHEEVKNYTCAAPRASAAPANDPEWQANTSISGRRRTVTKSEFIKRNLKNSWCQGGVVEVTSSLETEEQNLTQTCTNSVALLTSWWVFACSFLRYLTFHTEDVWGWEGFKPLFLV